ncbi:unnamed protein product [Withania somnifera]
MKINAKTFRLIGRILVLLSFFHLYLVSRRKNVNGFTVDLIHRDSPLSPFYNPSNTPSDRLRNAFHRSFSRASFFKKKFVNAIQSTLTPSQNEYLMKISIGTPPVESLVIVDTGSDLTWIQCEPCVDCYKQLPPIFNPKNSSSYKTVACNNKLCQEVWSFSCKNNNTCNYEVMYLDQSHTIGDLSSETFTFASTCGGSISIVNQINQEIKGKFSYCLIPLDQSSSIHYSNATSHINFGDSAIVSGPGVVSTPLIKKEGQETAYFLNLESISIGNKTFPFKSSNVSSNTQGNIIIDSGTTLMYIPFDIYLNLEKTLVASINGTRIDDPFGFFNVCYATKDGSVDAPKIVVHFTNADLELPPTNTFTQLDEGLVCFTMVPEEGLAIFGNLAQMNLLIGYDLVANQVSFLPTDCTKH